MKRRRKLEKDVSKSRKEDRKWAPGLAKRRRRALVRTFTTSCLTFIPFPSAG
jgi:hypothetical protein